jgi:hypothetical protein
LGGSEADLLELISGSLISGDIWLARELQRIVQQKHEM